MEYRFRDIEKKWRQRWKDTRIYEVKNGGDKPKCYVLDMFPYPSGAGLHVGHPLGYIASDIYARYKRLKGYNVLHPMGFDAFGLPAEQYALETGQHPAVTTDQNIASFKRQMDNIGFCFDWSREIRTSDPAYYRWTQWIFLQLFGSWYDRTWAKARPIDELTDIFASEGNASHLCPADASLRFTAAEWNGFSHKRKQDVLMDYRLAYSSYGEVNWCEALGTVLANDEVVNGVSERGGYPVVRKRLRQWYLRITEYADRLLEGLAQVDFSDAMKEMQTNWIGRSTGAEITFAVRGAADDLPGLRVYTTRPDTIFGVDFMVLAPELDLVDQITTPGQAAAVEAYLAYVKSRSERERMAEKKITGCFTGAYAVHPFTGREIPIWVSEYVLSGYGTGAIMAVPCGDERDFRFAKHFGIPVTNIIGDAFNGEEANPSKDAILSNSGFLDGMIMRDAAVVVAERLRQMGIGTPKVNYKMRDAAFSRQRYWGEPFPIRWEDGVAVPLEESELPLELPHVDAYRPGPEGEGPLANLRSWTEQHYETNTMPGYAGSSWYFLRYDDPHNSRVFADRAATDYWNQVDVYIGGTEHAVGHLLYSRMWTKLLYDLGYIGFDEPYRRLINQGMITGKSFFAEGRVYLAPGGTERLVLSSKREEDGSPELVIDGVSCRLTPGTQQVRLRYAHKYLDANGRLPRAAFEIFLKEQADQLFDIASVYVDWSRERTTETGEPYLEGIVVEKMSKSKRNVENPDDVVEKYGADTFRMYEMFLGPLEQSKPWDTQGIEGVHRFLKKFWRLFYDDAGNFAVTDEAPTESQWRTLHRTIRKVGDDTERFSFNTVVSQLMICVNELASAGCRHRDILEPVLILLAPFAPHISEELYHQLGHETSVLDAAYPAWEEKYLREAQVVYPVAINGKTRAEMTFDADTAEADIRQAVLKNEVVGKWMDGKPLKKLIIVKNRMINVVI
jgi:leucyl-tRNA synthetase